jgi:hypothetical protein
MYHFWLHKYQYPILIITKIRSCVVISGTRHRNLSTRTRMFELLLQNILGKNPCKKSADLHPRQGNLPHWNRAQQNLSSLHKIGWRTSWKKFARFFSMHVLDLDFYGTHALQPLKMVFRGGKKQEFKWFFCDCMYPTFCTNEDVQLEVELHRKKSKRFFFSKRFFLLKILSILPDSFVTGKRNCFCGIGCRKSGP